MSGFDMLDPQFFAQFGVLGVGLAYGYRAVNKLYTDMREDSKRREDMLMGHLTKVTDTLDHINLRLQTLEDFIKKG